MGASASNLVYEPSSTTFPTLVEPISMNMGVDSSWLPRIQRLALALTPTSSLLDDPTLVVLLTKNAPVNQNA